jgi:hypothetical protein
MNVTQTSNSINNDKLVLLMAEILRNVQFKHKDLKGTIYIQTNILQSDGKAPVLFALHGYGATAAIS